MHNKVLNFPTMIVSVVSLFCVANAGGQGPPTYYASQGHYWPQSFQSLSENRTLTGIVSASEGEMKRIVTTGGFVGPYQPLVNESSDSVPGGHDWVLSRIFGGFRVPTTENGHTMLWVGTTSGGGSPQTSSVAIWKADGTFIIHSPILGARELIPRDMNESLRIAGNLVTDVDRLV